MSEARPQPSVTISLRMVVLVVMAVRKDPETRGTLFPGVIADRGYTMHSLYRPFGKHLDDFGLIIMNGRVYGPQLSRFLSPDPFVSSPGHTQALNRYSYVLNNPTKYTDPSGYVELYSYWDGKASGGHGSYPVTYDISQYFTMGGAGAFGPGSGKHWSDPYRSQFGNFMLMNSTNFDLYYGSGSYANAVALYDNKSVFHQWGSGGFGLADVKWDPLGGAEVGRKKYRKDGTNYLDIYYEGSWALDESQGLATSGGDDAANGGGTDFSLARMYGHFQFGGGKPLTINASTLDFSGTNQRALGLDKLKVGQTMDPVNLFNMGTTNPAALAFGRVPMTRVSETEFTIGNNGFDFTPFYDPSASTGRNVGNAIGFGVNYNLWLGPGSVLIPVIFGGPYDVIFNGTVTIPK